MLQRTRLIFCVFLLLFGYTLVAKGQPGRFGANYTLVEQDLYLGGHVDTPPPGTRAVLNLCEIEDRYRCDVHAWHAIRDSAPAPRLEWLLDQVEFIVRQRKAGRSTYVHCQAGISRAPMVVAAYLMLKHRWTREEAIEFLRERRPQVGPNAAFLRLLDEWEQALRKK